MNDVFKLRPGHAGPSIPTVERKEWGDTANVGGVVSAIGEALLDEAVSKIPGKSLAGRVFKRVVRRGVSNYRYGRRSRGYTRGRSGGYRKYGGGYGRRYTGMRYRKKYSGYKRKRRSAFGRYRKRRRYYK